jgi:hypothetical protein
MSDMKRWRGLMNLVREAVVHGSTAVEEIQVKTAARPFGVLEQVPGLAAPARVVHAVHDAAVATTHISIRAVTKLVATSLDVALDVVEKREPPKHS